MVEAGERAGNISAVRRAMCLLSPTAGRWGCRIYSKIEPRIIIKRQYKKIRILQNASRKISQNPPRETWTMPLGFQARRIPTGTRLGSRPWAMVRGPRGLAGVWISGACGPKEPLYAFGPSPLLEAIPIVGECCVLIF